jgi:hypothetical protein
MATANAELLVIKGMGHELSEMNDYWVRIIDAIVNHMGRVTRKQTSAQKRY